MFYIERWFIDAMNIYEVENMILERIGNDYEKSIENIKQEDVPTLESMIDDIETVISLETHQINDIIDEEDLESLKKSKKTVSDCNKWLKKYRD